MSAPLEASASSMLINIGADIAFVGTTKGESVRISARAKT